MRKPAFCICKNKDADQLRGNREADQRLCFCYIDSTIPLLSNYEISRLQPSSVDVQSGLCRTWSETPKTGFLRTRLIYLHTLHLYSGVMSQEYVHSLKKSIRKAMNMNWSNQKANPALKTKTGNK